MDSTKTVGAYLLRGTNGADAHFGTFKQFGFTVTEAANGAITMPVVLSNGGSGPVRGYVAWTGTDASATVHTATKVDFGSAGGTETITAISVANPTHVTSTAHGLVSGDAITIAGSDSTPVIDGVRLVTVLDANHFTVPVNVTVLGTTGTFHKTSRRFGIVLCAMVLSLGSGSMIPVWEQSADGSTNWAAITGSTMAAMTLADGVRYVHTSVTQLQYEYVRVSSTSTFTNAQWIALASRPASFYDA